MTKPKRGRGVINIASDTGLLVTRRAEVEAHLAAFLRQSGSGASVEQFKKFIYEKGSVISLGEYVSLTFRLFPAQRRDVDIDTRLSVLTDAWNYFPHRARGGKCPAELLGELENK
jgi:hypothetical protein